MRERRYVKFRVDMFEDTKLKIINRRLERDLIDYVWLRLGLLAGKVNREGDLFMSRNIPYTVETLAIEFDREVEQVKLALDILMELEMLELTEHNVYRVKNFAKHQNIKVKEKDAIKIKEDVVKAENKEISKEDNLKNESKFNENQFSEDIEFEDELSQSEPEVMKIEEAANMEINNNDFSETENNMTKEKEKEKDDFQDDIPILKEVKGRNKPNSKRNSNNLNSKKKKQDILFEITDEENSDCEIIAFQEGEAPLGKNDKIIMQLAFD